MTTATKLARSAGVFLGNLLTAWLGTGMVESSLYGLFFHPQTRGGMLLKEGVLSGLVAFALGYFVYRMWRPASSKWVWLAGLCWFGYGALAVGGERSPAEIVLGVIHRNTIYWEMSGIGCISDLKYCGEWIQFTLPLLRTVFYSAGAFCSFHFGPATERALVGRFRSTDATQSTTDDESKSAK